MKISFVICQFYYHSYLGSPGFKIKQLLVQNGDSLTLTYTIILINHLSTQLIHVQDVSQKLLLSILDILMLLKCSIQSQHLTSFQLYEEGYQIYVQSV